MLLNKYRAKVEEEIEIKQREAEYLEVRMMNVFFFTNKSEILIFLFKAFETI